MLLSIILSFDFVNRHELHLLLFYSVQYWVIPSYQQNIAESSFVFQKKMILRRGLQMWSESINVLLTISQRYAV